MTARSAIVLAVANQKGGVGKTTTSVNLAASLAAAEQRTLLVDVDPQANASSGVGVRPRTVERSLYDVLVKRIALEDALLDTEVPELELLPATQDLVGVDFELVDAEDRATRLRELLAPLRLRYDYIVLDCPPSLGLLTVNALTAADKVLVPMQCEYYALEGLTQLMATIDRVRGLYNPALTVAGIVLTMFDVRNSLTHQVAAEVRDHFHVFDAVIPRNVRLSEAPSHGKPALLYDIQCKGAQGYLSLARELIQWLAEGSTSDGGEIDGEGGTPGAAGAGGEIDGEGSGNDGGNGGANGNGSANGNGRANGNGVAEQRASERSAATQRLEGKNERREASP
jgi:chromosome partitioning protein